MIPANHSATSNDWCNLHVKTNVLSSTSLQIRTDKRAADYGARLANPAHHDHPGGLLAHAQDEFMVVADEEERARTRLHGQPRARHVEPPALDDVRQKALVAHADVIIVLAHEAPRANRLPVVIIVHRHLLHLDDFHLVVRPDLAVGLHADGLAQVARVLHANQVLEEERVFQHRPLRNVGHHVFAANALAVLEHPIPGHPGARAVRGASHKVGLVVVQGLSSAKIKGGRLEGHYVHHFQSI